jgi:membrane protein
MPTQVSHEKATVYQKVLKFLKEEIWHVELSDLKKSQKFLLSLLQFLSISLRKFVTDRGLMMASALTFSTLLALIPFLAVVFTFFSLLGGAEWVENHIRPIIFNLLSTGSGEKLAQSLSDFVRNASLGTIGTLGSIFLVITTLSLLNTIESAFNQVWSVGESRPLLKKVRDYWSALTIGPILIVVSLFLTTSLGKVGIVKAILSQSLVNHFLTLIMPLILQWVAFYLFFQMIPNTAVRSSSAALGALVGSVLWEIAKAGYVTYTSSAVRYNLIYGSVAIVPIFMIWMYLTWVAVLIGVEISYVHQNFLSLRWQKRKIQLSYSQKELLGLTVMAEVAQRFMEGNPPTTIYEMSQRLRLPAEHVRSVIQQFRDNQMLSNGTDDSPLVVVQDLDRISVQAMIEALQQSGKGSLYLDQDELYQSVSELVQRWLVPGKKLLGDTTLRQLAMESNTPKIKNHGKA